MNRSGENNKTMSQSNFNLMPWNMGVWMNKQIMSPFYKHHLHLLMGRHQTDMICEYNLWWYQYF